MVIARNPSAASFLCQAWRERNSVQKTYLAHVLRWPPYHEKQLREGTIDLPLAASRTERIKWEVRPVVEGGKASLTFWKVYKDHTVDNNGNQNINLGVTLELHPVTGRTHQLRIHSAEIGSGIEGDSLYGDSPIKWFGDTHENIQNSYRNEHGIDTQPALDAERPNTLRLHAYELTFPHPTTGKKVTFVSPKSW